MKKIFAELARIQQELKAPKTLYNSFGKYNYRNAEGILESVKPLLNGLVLIINDEPVLIGDRFYIKATVTITDGEESVSATAYAREDDDKKGMDGCQITGACSSYARKYALNALLMIDDSKDSDDDSLSPRNPANDKPPQKPKNENPAHATVTTAAQLPTAKKALDVATPRGYLLNEIAFMAKRLGISDRKEMNAKFESARKALVAGGVVPDVGADEMTMEQAKHIAAAVSKTLIPGGDDQ